MAEFQLPEVDRMQHELAEMREEIRRLRDLELTSEYEAWKRERKRARRSA